MKRKNIMKEVFEFVESAVPSPDIIVNAKRGMERKVMKKEIKRKDADEFVKVMKYLDMYVGPIAMYNSKENVITLNNLLSENIDEVIKVIDHEYIHAALHALGLHDESHLLDSIHGTKETIGKEGI
jgi:hypothetical protein